MIYNLDGITLTVKNEKPPIWDEAHKYLKIIDEESVYTYDGILYNPSGLNVGELMMEHEKSCAAQQLHFEGGAKAWWDKYLTDEIFREEQDFEEYWYQYKLYCKMVASRDRRFNYRWLLAGEFIRPFANPTVTRMEACNLLKTDIHK